jgi:tetratricopeptide (TPR) repeat protein
MEFIDGSTLTRWVNEERRRWQEVLDVYRRAGQGLAAAHAAGIIHRDFKPENVLLGKDGRVRVLDFGLARQVDGRTRDATDLPAISSGTALDGPAVEETVADAAGSGALSSLNVDLTRTGGVMGTPAYMAPEQHVGIATDARTDQFSFCVALYEGLYGERPFHGATAAAVAFQVTHGKVRDAPKDAKVPGWLRAVLIRGMQSNPADRFPSMDALLAELARDPGARRRAWLAAGATLTAIAAIVFGVMQGGDATSVCAGAQDKLVGVWDDARRAQVTEAFTATGKAFAADALASVSAELDGYAEGWVAMHTDACEATAVRREQSQDLLDRRMICLERSRKQLRALAKLLGEADGDVVERAVEAARALPPLAHCADAEALMAGEVPLSGELREKVDEFEDDFANARALYHAGNYKEASEAATETVGFAREISHEPSIARALDLLGGVQTENGEHKEAVVTLHEAVAVADAARDDRTRASAAADLIGVLGHRLTKPDEARSWAELASAATKRIGGDPELEARIEQNLGTTAMRAAEHDRAEEHFLRSLEIRRAAQGEGHPDLAFALGSLGLVAFNRGEYEKALDYHARVLAIQEAENGPDHPNTGTALNNLANANVELANYEEALRLYNRVLSIAEKNHGKNHPMIANALNNLAVTLQRQTRLEEALAVYERALALVEAAYEPDDYRISHPLTNIGNVLCALRRPQEAHEHYRRAFEIKRKVVGDDHPAVGSALLNSGRAYFLEGKYREAIDHYRRAAEIWRARQGDDHPDLGIVENNLGDVAEKQSRYGAGAAHYQRAIELFEPALGKDHPDLAFPLAGLGLCQIGLGKRDAARKTLERALALREKDPGAPGETSRVQMGLARALWPEDKETALRLARSARDGYERELANAPELDDVKEWLAAHGG